MSTKVHAVRILNKQRVHILARWSDSFHISGKSRMDLDAEGMAKAGIVTHGPGRRVNGGSVHYDCTYRGIPGLLCEVVTLGGVQ